jgi:hypothetical protein
VNDEMERIRKEAVMAQFKALSQHLLGGNEEEHKKPQSEYPVFRLRFETGTS